MSGTIYWIDHYTVPVNDLQRGSSQVLKRDLAIGCNWHDNPIEIGQIQTVPFVGRIVNPAKLGGRIDNPTYGRNTP